MTMAAKEMPLDTVTKRKRAGFSYRKFAVVTICYIAAFLSFNLITWKCFTEMLLTDKYDGGDLARMGYLPWAKHKRKTHILLPRKHIEPKDYYGQHIDVITIGDSFSLGGGRGKNPYYQDYIASNFNYNVLNIYPYPTWDLMMGCSPMSTLAVLYNSGYLDIIKPRYVIIESLESFVPPRFNRPFDFSWKDDLAKVVDFYKTVNTEWPPLPKVTFINKGNFDVYYRNILYQFSDSAFGKVVEQKELNRPLFSIGSGTKLLFHRYDVESIANATPEAVAIINDNLNKIAELLAKKGIKLIFMPVVTKYNLYSDYLKESNHPRSKFFEELRPLPKRYTFIDTKAILGGALKKGEKDIYFSDDTHWSWKASELIFSNFRFP